MRICAYICTHMICVCIYIYRERERGRESERYINNSDNHVMSYDD